METRLVFTAMKIHITVECMQVWTGDDRSVACYIEDRVVLCCM